MKTRNLALATWLSGYAGVAAGVLTLGSVPAAANHGNASVYLVGFFGLALVLWGTALMLRPNPRIEWLGVGVNAGAAVLACLDAASASTGPGAGHMLRLILSLTAMGLTAYLLTQPTAAAPITDSRKPLGITGLALGTGLLLALIWFGAAALPVRALTPRPGDGGSSPTPAHGAAHADGMAYQGMYRVRLTGVQAGPYVVQAFTGPTEVGDLFVEVGARNLAGAVQGDLLVQVEAAPADGMSVPVGGVATSRGAQVPGNYAIHLPVTSAGFWNVTLTIDGPLGSGVAGFAERVGGTANIAMWVLAGVPLAIALLFGLVYVRTAGRAPRPAAGP